MFINEIFKAKTDNLASPKQSSPTIKENTRISKVSEEGGPGYPKTPKFKVGDSVTVDGYTGVGKIVYIKHREDVGVIIQSPTVLRVHTNIDSLHLAPVKEASGDHTDTVTLDIPLLIRLLEYAREDAGSDIDLHNIAENMIELGLSGCTLSMQDYDDIVG